MGFLRMRQEKREEKELFAKLLSSEDMIGTLTNHVARLAELKKGISAEYMDKMQHHLEMFYKYYKTMEAKEVIEGHIQQVKGNAYILAGKNIELHDDDILEVYIDRYSLGKGRIVRDWHLTMFFKPVYGAAYFASFSEVPVEGALVRLKRPAWDNKKEDENEDLPPNELKR